jgi:hypothetical protein
MLITPEKVLRAKLPKSGDYTQVSQLQGHDECNGDNEMVRRIESQQE